MQFNDRNHRYPPFGGDSAELKSHSKLDSIVKWKSVDSKESSIAENEEHSLLLLPIFINVKQFLVLLVQFDDYDPQGRRPTLTEKSECILLNFVYAL